MLCCKQECRNRSLFLYLYIRDAYGLCSTPDNATAVRPSKHCSVVSYIEFRSVWDVSCAYLQTNIMETLLEHFWDSTQYRIDCVKCLTEIGGLPLEAEDKQYLPKLAYLWSILCTKLAALPPESVKYDDPHKVPPAMRIFWETFYVQLAICLTAFLKQHREDVAEQDLQSCLNGLQLLVQLSLIPHDETFKICLDFWQHFADTLLKEVLRNYKQSQASPLILSAEENFGVLASPESYSKRLVVYQPLLRDVRKLLVERMAKPQEIYIQFDEETGEVTREYQTDTDEVSLYNVMRDTQVLLANLGQTITRDILLEALNRQEIISKAESWNPTALNRLCYSVGSISGAMDETTERQFLVHIIKDLLAVCEMKRGKQNKAVVASNIMYVVGQYPRFLRQHWKFLKTVLLKLFEFMNETFPGVQKMACETFLKIAQKCKHAIAQRYSDGDTWLLVTVLELTEQQTRSGIDDKYALYLYQAMGHLISASEEGYRQPYMERLMAQPNSAWETVMAAATTDPASLFYPDTAKVITKVLTVNHAVAKSAGYSCRLQLLALYPHMLTIYSLYSKRLNSEASANPSRVLHADMKTLILARRETLHLVETFIEHALTGGGGRGDGSTETNGHVVNEGIVGKQGDWSLEERRKDIMEKFVCPLLEPVLEDYHSNLPSTRDQDVLSLVSTILTFLGTHVAECLPRIFDCLFGSTLDMIKGDFHSYPDHRSKFYDMLMTCNRHCFNGLMGLPQEKLRTYVESLVWAFKHEQPSVAEQGLKITAEFLQRLITDRTHILLEFCKVFYYSLVFEILSVMTDTLHKSGFKHQTLILMRLIGVLESGLVNDEATELTKQQFTTSLVSYLDNSFQTLNRRQVEAFVVDMFNYSQLETRKFETHVRDFLIQIKEFADLNEELFEREKQEALQRAQELDQQKRMQVPGMVPQYADMKFEVDDY